MPGKGHWDACVFVLFRHVGMWCGFMPNTGPLVLARWMTWGQFLQYFNLSFLGREIQGPSCLLNASQSWPLVNITWAAFEEGMWVLLHTNRIGITADRSLALASTILLAQSCPNLCDPVDCSLSGSSVYGSGLPFPLQGIFPTQGSNPGLLHCRQTLYPLSHQESPSSSILKPKERQGRKRGDGETKLGFDISVFPSHDQIKKKFFLIKIFGINCTTVLAGGLA